jgi:amino acid transporter
MTDENERQAAAIKISISSYVGTATLALIGGAVALFTYVEQNFAISPLFWVLILLAMLALVTSFGMGGRGSNHVANSVAAGLWKSGIRVDDFDRQAVLTLLGLVLIVISAFVGASAPPRPGASDPCLGIVATDLGRSSVTLSQVDADLQRCESTRH